MSIRLDGLCWGISKLNSIRPNPGVELQCHPFFPIDISHRSILEQESIYAPEFITIYYLFTLHSSVGATDHCVDG